MIRKRTLQQAVVGDLVVAIVGGSRHSRRPAKATHKPVFVWQVSGRGAVALCEAIEPYLLIKQAHARLLVESYSLVRRGKRRPLTEAQRAERATVNARFRVLNRRGVA